MLGVDEHSKAPVQIDLVHLRVFALFRPRRGHRAKAQYLELLDRRFSQHSFSFALSVVVVAPAYVLVRERKRALRVGCRDAVEAVLEDRLDVSVRAGADAQGAAARGFEAGFAVAFSESENAQA